MDNTRKVTVQLEVPEDMTNEQLHEHLCRVIHEGQYQDLEDLMNTVSDITIVPRHRLDTLNGIVEAALNNAMEDERWLTSMANDRGGEFTLPNTADECYQELEEYICDVLARV